MILLYDCNFLLHRILHLPEFFNLNHNGIPTGGVSGVLHSIHTTLTSTHKPRIQFAVWDGSRSERRLQIYPDYKGNRNKPKNDQDKQIQAEYFASFTIQKQILFEKALPLLGICLVLFPKKEADDVIYKLVELYKDEDEIIIISEDSDLTQIINKFPNVKVFKPIKKQLITKDNFEDYLGVPPEHFLLSKAICGDASDNIKGIEGIGEVTVKKIIKELDKADPTKSLLAFAEKNRDAKNRFSKIILNWGVIARNLELVDISREEFSPSEIEALRQAINNFKPVLYREHFFNFCQTHGLNKILNNFNFWIHSFSTE